MSSFLDDLARQALDRESRGMTRRLVVQTHDQQLDLAGNDYLGLRQHPHVQSGAIAAVEDFGTGSGAPRLITGTLPIHAELEEALADHLDVEQALVFSTGYLANLGAICALAEADTTIISDAHNHASLIDGARLARAEVAVFPHGDLDAVERLLRQRTTPRAMVVVESVSSILGDAAPLTELVELTDHHDATLLVDEAHAVGVRGPRGGGLLRQLGLAGLDHVVVTASLSKALAAQGGVVLGHRMLCEHLVNTARPFLFDTGLAPASAGAALAALDVIEDEPQLGERAMAHTARLAEACGLETPAGPLMSVLLPGSREALVAADICAAHGVRVGCLRPPSTPDGTSRLRITAHANHTEIDVAHAAKVLSEITQPR
ncbi:8-amino-7-oxononanoate synthase [Segeticoccus rhizosphaerae]|uniref:8-amino-7-oxononanoate synthase n=1 Tax=Segeticoccus rhizosphaerae TaxID=1104777 RepID=UPI00192E68AF|nr:MULTISPECIES: 8-amino-7-oxononanoate synthase [Intrasporangiaceae]